MRDNGQPAAARASAIPAARAWRERIPAFLEGCQRLATAAAAKADRKAMPCTPSSGAQPAIGPSTCA
ncbi:hypothetical protein D9M68_896270 [compost metagenome]